uniref:Tyrosine-protein phosphatase domain-containing protein n=1 Tax=Parastrongyloides trichosuri TaxID=131310 RepID=A0A0N4Z8T2_PARTI
MKIYWLNVFTFFVLLCPWKNKLSIASIYVQDSSENNLKDGKIAYEINTETESDVIMVRCPKNDHKYNADLTEFHFDKKSNQPIKSTLQEDQKFIWSMAKKEVTDQNFKVHCGEYKSKDNYGIEKPIPWDIKFKGKDSTNYLKKNVDRLSVSEVKSNTTEAHNKCNKSNGKIIIFAMDEKGTLTYVDKLTDEKMHTKKKYYFFLKHLISSAYEFQKPCAVALVYYDAPKFLIKEYNSKLIVSQDTIFVNHLEKGNKQEYTIELKTMSNKNFENFYSDEEISYQKMVYRDGELKVAGTDKVKTYGSTFVDGFEILQFSYSVCTKYEETRDLTENFYFGPENKNIVYKNFVNVTSATSNVNPQCSFEKYSFAYLFEIHLGNGTIKMDEFINNTNSIISFTNVGDTLSFAANVKGKLDFKCIYRTLDGYVTDYTLYYDTDMYKKETTHDGNDVLINLQPLNKNGGSGTNLKKNIFQILRDKIGLGGIILSFLLIILVIVISTVLLYIFVLKKRIKSYYFIKKKKETYPNIFAFWNEVKRKTLKAYVTMVSDPKFSPVRCNKNKSATRSVTGSVTRSVTRTSEEQIDEHTGTVFDENIVKCFKNIDQQIMAHYIEGVSLKRKYIVSDGPTLETVKHFFKMLYLENVAAVIAIISKRCNENGINSNNPYYWPDEPIVDRNLIVEPKRKSKTTFEFMVTLRPNPPKYVTIFHISDWDENCFPLSIKDMVDVYKIADGFACDRTVLIHNTQVPDSRTFIFLYLGCILERMIRDVNIDNPLLVIKEIREKCVGGALNENEFAFIVSLLVKEFFARDCLFDKEAQRLNFNVSMDTLLYETKIDETTNNRLYLPIVKFLEAANVDKVQEILERFVTIQRFVNETIEKKCTRFIAVRKNQKLNKIRHPSVYCLDKTSICIRGASMSDPASFFHANEMVYEIKDNIKRKFIMCMAPLPSTFEDMYDMLVRCNVGIIVILASSQELHGGAPKWHHYLPLDNKPLETPNFSIVRTGGKLTDRNNISETYYTISTKTDQKVTSNFKVFHYDSWPDKSAPIKTFDILELYTRVLNDENALRHIVVHCTTGIGRTGTFVLMFHMLDTIQTHGWFNPLKSLDFVRKHRYLAVQTQHQFCFAISSVLNYFREELVKIDEMAVTKFEALIKDALHLTFD